MSDIVKLLPDSIANQIAAGEVIQRPASVVKELLENSVDAGATSIQLIVKDSGKALIQTVDNGKGMSEADARMSLERHATSKISSADDLFQLRTMGFRGEALASIAAVAQLDMKTRSADREVGTAINVEASTVKNQEICAMEVGTTISVKNLFYNVPARRKFLKSDAVEMRHIIDEFQRVALVNPDLEFKLFHNGQQLFQLPASNRRQRIIGILGKSYNEKLVPLEEETDLVKLTGFIGKPNSAKKSRGEQFLFVNGRYFKSPYFHSAIQKAFEGLVPHGHHPSYFIYFDVDPKSIDINIHPTKTEIKFEDERSVYAILRSTVKRSLGQYHVSQSIDFERESAFDILPPKKGEPIERPGVMVNTDYNPFQSKGEGKQQWERGSTFQKPMTEGWEALYEGLEQDLQDQPSATPELDIDLQEDSTLVRQIGNRYVLVQSAEGVFLIHQYRAHSRVLFESFEEGLMQQEQPIQQLLFPATIELSTQDAAIFESVVEPLCQIGFEVESFGNNAYIVRGVPAVCMEINVEQAIAGFIDDLRQDKPSQATKLQEKVIKSMAQHTAIRSGDELKAQEMITLFRDLMRCKQPQYDLSGNHTFMLMNTSTIDKLFGS
ncbi:MAG: DNA mismatch repair endonuclease MutL [Salibacteraceae bacterium]